MEVHVEDIPRIAIAHVVAHVLPLTADAWVRQDPRAILLGERCA